MARPSDEDSGVISLQELAPRYTNSGAQQRPPEQPATPFWSSQMPVAAPPYGQPPTWSSGQWSVPLQPIDPPHYTPRPIGLGMRRPRRWGLRFVMFLGLVGLGAFLGRSYLPRFPRSLAEVPTFWESLSASVRRASGGLLGKTPPARPEVASAPAAHASRGPQIVPLPSDSSPAAPPPVAAEKARPRPQAEPAPEPARPRVIAPAPRPVKVAAVSKPASARRENDPFESDAAAAAALAKPLSTPVAAAAKPHSAPVAVAAPREAPAPVERAPVERAPVERARPAPKPVPGSLDDLMSSSLKGPAKTSKEIDRRLAGVNEVRDAEPRKKVEAEPAPARPLSRNDIQTVMRGVAAKVSTDCYQKFQQMGPADLKLAVNEGGSVTSASVSGQFAGTPTGACVERVVKAASFPESAGLRFDYRISVR